MFNELQNKKLHPSWVSICKREMNEIYFIELLIFLKNEYKSTIVFPKKEYVFAAFSAFPLKETKVVILGQDPYHNENQANGFSFSVSSGMRLPPSLRNIYKEIESDLGIEMSGNGDLSSWSKQGILLLNTVLTVRKNEPNSHQKKGWEVFTDEIIKEVNNQCEYVVFILWGKNAQSKLDLLDGKKHLILTSSHPSPFSSYQGFVGCKHFSKTNEFLSKHNRKIIDWKI